MLSSGSVKIFTFETSEIIWNYFNKYKGEIYEYKTKILRMIDLYLKT